MDMKNQEEISDTLTMKLSELTKIIEPPYAEEIERAVLGVLMVDPNALNCTGELNYRSTKVMDTSPIFL